MARTLLAGQSVLYDGDPLRDLTLGAFLEKFVTKKAKVLPANSLHACRVVCCPALLAWRSPTHPCRCCYACSMPAAGGLKGRLGHAAAGGTPGRRRGDGGDAGGSSCAGPGCISRFGWHPCLLSCFLPFLMRPLQICV